MIDYLFYIFATITLVSANAMIFFKNPVKALLCLILAFVTSAMIWMLLAAEFLSIALILVYVGAVLVLFMFVVMMLDVDTAELKAILINYPQRYCHGRCRCCSRSLWRYYRLYFWYLSGVDLYDTFSRFWYF